MGKKSREKKAKRADGDGAGRAGAPPQKGLYGQLEDAGSGDLRLVGQHIEHFLEGVREAEEALLLLGRDASALVIAEANARQSEALATLGKKLAAMPPRISTNLYALRKASVETLAVSGKTKAPKLAKSPKVEVQGNAVALFDPVRVADALARSGRVRNDTERVVRGDIAWFGLGSGASHTVQVVSGAPSEPSRVRLGLEISSGVLFVGPPEAADGPRLGTVRLDPHKTALDDHAVRGGFVAVPPGRYQVAVSKAEGGVIVHLAALEGDAPFDVELAHLGESHAE